MSNAREERVFFFVDGFNLYHSVVSAEDERGGRSVKWLDLNTLFTDHLYLIGPTARLHKILYFTAYAYHLSRTRPGKIARHKAYTRALTAAGVEVCEAHFKKKTIQDTREGRRLVVHEEKETDVAIACAVLEGAASNLYDIAVLVTRDTDLRPVVFTFKRLYPDKQLLFAFPYRRKNKELAKIAPGSFTFSAKAYAKYQFPDEVPLPSGKVVRRPAEWK